MTITIGENPYAKEDFLMSLWEKTLQEIRGILEHNMKIRIPYGYGNGCNSSSGYTYMFIDEEKTVEVKSLFNHCKKWEDVDIISIGIIPSTGVPFVEKVTVSSISSKYNNLTKKIAIIFAKHYQVVLRPYEYDGKEVNSGSIKCKYCGQFTHNAEKCDSCGGVPI